MNNHKIDEGREIKSHYINELLVRYPSLKENKHEIISAYRILLECYKHGNKILIAGNGGAASDSQHIVAELMKGFRLERPIERGLANKLLEIDTARGEILASKLEMGLPAISLVSQDAFGSAYINDKYAEGLFAQQVLGYGRKGDVFWGISSSGDSENVICGAIVSKAIGMKTIGLTGKNGGALKEYVDVCVCVPETETYRIQELHLPIYHCWCMMLEESIFGGY